MCEQERGIPDAIGWWVREAGPEAETGRRLPFFVYSLDGETM